jgi:hypothetical protein
VCARVTLCRDAHALLRCNSLAPHTRILASLSVLLTRARLTSIFWLRHICQRLPVALHARFCMCRTPHGCGVLLTRLRLSVPRPRLLPTRVASMRVCPQHCRDAASASIFSFPVQVAAQLTPHVGMLSLPGSVQPSQHLCVTLQQLQSYPLRRSTVMAWSQGHPAHACLALGLPTARLKASHLAWSCTHTTRLLPWSMALGNLRVCYACHFHLQ